MLIGTIKGSAAVFGFLLKFPLGILSEGSTKNPTYRVITRTSMRGSTEEPSMV